MLEIKIWQRDFNIEVIYDCYQGEQILEVQKEALNLFVSNNSIIANSLSAVEDYCIKKNRDNIGSEHVDNIFKYVMPDKIFVKRDGRIAIMCNYRFDMEHGVAVVFKDNKFLEIGSQDIII